MDDIVGWKERYYWNKRRAPQVTLAFMHGSRTTGTNNYETYMIANRPNQIKSGGTLILDLIWNRLIIFLVLLWIVLCWLTSLMVGKLVLMEMRIGIRHLVGLCS